VIVRVLGEGQFRLPGALHDAVNALDDAVLRAVEAGDEGSFGRALAALVAFIRAHGVPVPPAELVGSDAIVPAPDSRLHEARSLLAGDGLIPG
jgi:hypothetical protein